MRWRSGHEGSAEQAQTIHEYSRRFPDDVQAIIKHLRQVIQAAAPGAREAISYGIPAFMLNGRGLIYFGVYKKHVGMYPVPAGSAAFNKQLGAYRTGKGTLQFPLDKPMPYSLISRIVRARMREEARPKAK